VVAVKIQYPEAEQCFNSDMTTLRHFAEVGREGGREGGIIFTSEISTFTLFPLLELQIAQPAYVKMLDEVRKEVRGRRGKRGGRRSG